MKYTSLQSLGPVVGVAFVLVACASSDDSVQEPVIARDSGITSFPEDSGMTAEDTYVPTTVYDSGTRDTSVTAEDSSVAPTGCTGKCSQNSDCAAICTPPSGDVACCDTATSMCYVASGECQATTTSPGEDASAPY